ncbi:MAG TPA: 5-oxoprolinase subunit PxpB [Chloroflexia bacterium]|nr:5-oxoprolinase subunit PxpB [Chloroflexia bacterium]
MAKGDDGWHVANMGEAALLVTLGTRVTEKLISAVDRLRAWLSVHRPPGIVDLVPGYASILVIFEPTILGEESLRVLLREGEVFVGMGNDGESDTGSRHVIPVAYGGEFGPDLDSVAEMHALTPAEVIRLHSGRVYKVAFLGFLPGFAYMRRLSKRIASPRLSVPRPRVPSGSVGLAGFQTGVYPFTSPGGWQIIGRTGVNIWDPTRAEPALFAPGDTVRFAPTNDISVQTKEVHAPETNKNPVFEVLEAGGLTTVQDRGRDGFAHLGLGAGGAFDSCAAYQANALVRNESHAAVLEMTWTGPRVRALRNVTIALAGSNFHLVSGSTPVPLGLSWFVRGGSVLRFVSAPSSKGMRSYMAVAGGFDAPLVLGSRSTSLLAGFGGIDGRAIQTGDVLGVADVVMDPVSLAGRSQQQPSGDISREERTLRFVPFSGPQAALPAAVEQLISDRWLVTEHADRMGLRFRSEGGKVLPVQSEESASFGVVRGTIQLPPGGLPVVLGVDHQTTGGYPVLGVVIEADLSILAQLMPGCRVRFVSVSVEDARAARAAFGVVERASP